MESNREVSVQSCWNVFMCALRLTHGKSRETSSSRAIKMTGQPSRGVTPNKILARIDFKLLLWCLQAVYFVVRQNGLVARAVVDCVIYITIFSYSGVLVEPEQASRRCPETCCRGIIGQRKGGSRESDNCWDPSSNQHQENQPGCSTTRWTEESSSEEAR